MKPDYIFKNVRFFLIVLVVIVSSITLYPQNRPQVSLTADRVDIQQWERVNFKAELNYNDHRASYGFFINSEPVTIGVNNNEINDYEFQETGSFLVTVIAKSNQAVTNRIPSLADSIRINVRKVGLSIIPKEIITDEKVSFKLEYKSNDNYIRYRFHFGDNLPPSEWLNESQTSYVYKHPDTYRVYAEIGKFDGETLYASIQSEVKRVKVNIKPFYEVSLSAITYTKVDEKITFTANPITNIPNPNFRYQFDFGDNTDTAPRSQNNVEHSYRKPDTYKTSVKLFSRENQLLAESNVVTVRVQDLVIPPQSISFIVDPMEVIADQDVSFKVDLQTEHQNLRYRFYYSKDFQPSRWLDIPESNHKYEKPGNYEVNAEVGRFDGESSYTISKTETKQVKVNPSYQVKLSAPVSVQVDDSINFRVELITNAENRDFRFQIDFGDLTPAVTQSNSETQHTFRKADTFDAKVKLLSRDGNLLATSDFLRIKVNDIVIPPETVLLNVDPMEVNADEEVHFKVELQTKHQNLKYRLYYSQDFPPSRWLDIPESNHKYEKPGTYEVYAEVGRFDGDSVYVLARSETKLVKVNPFIDVRLSSETSAKVNEAITFRAEAITNITNPDFRFLFDFGDLTHTEPQTESTAIHRYDKEGEYTVTVRLLDIKSEVVAVSSLIIIIEQQVNILLYILLALGGLIGGSLTLKYLIKPKLKLRPKSDTGIQSVTKEKDTLIDLTIRLNPNVNQAGLHLDASNEKLIDKIRRIK